MARRLKIYLYPPGYRPKNKSLPIARESWLAFSVVSIRLADKNYRDNFEVFCGGESKDNALQNLLESIALKKNLPLHKIRYKPCLVRH